MVRNRLPALVLALLLPLSLPASAEAPVRSGNAVFDGLVRTVDENFYRPAELDAFRDNVRKTVSETPALAGPNADAATVDHAIDRVLTGLHTSHTARYKQTQVDYYELLDVFRFGVRDAVRRLYPPDGEIAYPGIGIASKEIDGKRFVTDVYDGGPAALAGAKAGDEILSVDGAPFEEIGSFAGKIGGAVTLQVRRSADEEAMAIPVTVQALAPSETLFKAIDSSARVIDKNGQKIGYLHIWSYTRGEVGEIINRALATGALKDVDGLVLDLRCRWGGAPADAAETFVGGTGDFRLIDRDGSVDPDNVRWKKPVVAIIDEGTRSGMELYAYALKKNGIPLVGTRTAGALVAGRGFMLPDDSLLVLAVADVIVDGGRLEGKGVEPDVAVPFDVRYANGRDPQLDAAMERLGGML
jgi:C-terminal processing protease CtpA/Prc